MKKCRQNLRAWLSLALVIGLTEGCAINPKLTKRSHGEPKPLIALLPFANQSNNVEAPQKVRGALAQEMKQKDYRLLDMAQVDAGLKELGITEGGQLGAATLSQIEEKVAADWFCYGMVVDFTFRSAVALSQRKVELALKIVEAKTGKVVFEGQETGVTSRGGTDAAGDLAVTVAGKVFKSVKQGAQAMMPGEAGKKAADAADVIADVDLAQETHEALRKLLDKFPK